jgi:hypothetical protein
LEVDTNCIRRSRQKASPWGKLAQRDFKEVSLRLMRVPVPRNTASSRQSAEQFGFSDVTLNDQYLKTKRRLRKSEKNTNPHFFHGIMFDDSRLRQQSGLESEQ